MLRTSIPLTPEEERTGDLYGKLWAQHDAAAFEGSVQAFAHRLTSNAIDPGWLHGREVLDAGCGGGRCSIGMASWGANVTAYDISETGLEDAFHRPGAHQVDWRQANILDLPDHSESFDFIWCSGVLHHTRDGLSAFKGFRRVLREDGQMFLLVYGSPGLRFKVIDKLRFVAQQVGFEQVDAAIDDMGLDAGNRKTFLEDLFVPMVHYFSKDKMHGALTDAGFESIEKCPGPNETHNLPSLVTRLNRLRELFGILEKKKAVSFIEDALADLPGLSDEERFGEGSHILMVS